MASASVHVSVKIATIEVGSSVRNVDVEDTDRLIDKATITLDDTSSTASEVMREGAAVRIELGWDDDLALVFDGIVARTTASGPTPPRIVLTAYDRSWLLRRRTPAAANHVGRLSAIVTTLVTRDPAYGIQLGDVVPDPDPEFTAAQPLRQGNSQNDWDFIQQQAARYGCRAFVELNADIPKFYLVPEARLLRLPTIGNLCWTGGGGSLLELHLERDPGNAAPTRTAVSTDPASAQSVTVAGTPPAVETTVAPTDAARDRAPGGGERLDQALHAAAAEPIQPAALRPTTPQSGQPSDPTRGAQDARRDETAALGYRCSGTTVGNVHFRAKAMIGLDGVPAWATASWYVAKVNHVISRDRDGKVSYRTTFVATR